MPDQYRTRPTQIQAIRWTGDNAAEIEAIAPRSFVAIDPEDREALNDPDCTASVLVTAHSTWTDITTGQWVIKHANDEICTCDHEAFTAAYEPLEPTAPDSTKHPFVRDIEELKARHPHLPFATTPDPRAQQNAMADRLAYATGEAEAWQDRALRAEAERDQARLSRDHYRGQLDDTASELEQARADLEQARAAGDVYRRQYLQARRDLDALRTAPVPPARAQVADQAPLDSIAAAERWLDTSGLPVRSDQVRAWLDQMGVPVPVGIRTLLAAVRRGVIAAGDAAYRQGRADEAAGAALPGWAQPATGPAVDPAAGPQKAAQKAVQPAHTWAQLRDRLTAAITAALTPSPDVCGCPGQVAATATDAALTVITDGTTAAPAPGPQDIPTAWMLPLLRIANADADLDVADADLLDHARTDPYRDAIRSAYGLGYAAALGYEITVSPDSDQVHIGDRPAETTTTPTADGITAPDTYHWGRSWSPSGIEATCPCPTAPCGYVIQGRESPDCDEHDGTKTRRGGHPASRCPGDTKEVPMGDK